MIKQHWSFYLFSYSIYVCKRTPFLSCLNILTALKRSNQKEEILYRWHQRIGSLRTCKQQKVDFEFIHSWQAKVKGNFFFFKIFIIFQENPEATYLMFSIWERRDCQDLFFCFSKSVKVCWFPLKKKDWTNWMDKRPSRYKKWNLQ